MNAVRTHLVRRDAQLVLLLTPPFDRMTHDPGYIKGYLPGVRENGAQYTHAALWAVSATALLGDADRALELFRELDGQLEVRVRSTWASLTGWLEGAAPAFARLRRASRWRRAGRSTCESSSSIPTRRPP